MPRHNGQPKETTKYKTQRKELGLQRTILIEVTHFGFDTVAKAASGRLDGFLGNVDGSGSGGGGGVVLVSGRNLAAALDGVLGLAELGLDLVGRRRARTVVAHFLAAVAGLEALAVLAFNAVDGSVVVAVVTINLDETLLEAGTLGSRWEGRKWEKEEGKMLV